MLGFSLGVMGGGRRRLGGGAIGGPVAYIFTIIDQSNGVGTNDGTSVADHSIYDTDPRILQISGDAADGDALILATERFSWPVPADNETGKSYLMPFAKALLPTLGAEDVIIFVPCAVGGTSYTAGGGSRWPVGGDLYLNAIARTNVAKAAATTAYPGHTQSVVFMGTPGENDTPHVNGSDWLDLCVASYEGIQAATGTVGAPIINFTMQPTWTMGSLKNAPVEAAKWQVREAFPNTVIVQGPDDNDYDVIHYDAEGQRRRGVAAASALPIALARNSVYDNQVDWLDNITTPTSGSWSCWRRLRSGYTGAAYRMKRDNDAAETDIGFDADGIVDYAAAAAFSIGSTITSIITLYDQDDSGRDLSVPSGKVAPDVARDIDGIGRLLWASGRPIFGGSNGGLVGNFEIPVGGTALVSLVPSMGNNKIVFSSANLQFSTDPTGLYRAAADNGGAQIAGFSIPDSRFVSTVIVSDGFARVDGVDQTMVSVGNNNPTGAGYTSMMCRQLNPDTNGNLSQTYGGSATEMVFFSTTPDYAEVEGYTVGQYQADAYA